MVRLFRKKPSRIAEHELEVIKALLRPDLDERRERVYRQVLESTEVVRERGADSFRLNLEFTRGDLLIDLWRTVRGPWVRLRDVRTATDLEFRITLLEGGFFGSLEGRTVNHAPWPSDWQVDTSHLDANVAVAIPRERLDALPELARWLRLPSQPSPGDYASFNAPASPDDLARVEQAHDLPLPDGYASLLGIADGMRLGPVLILGTADLAHRTSAAPSIDRPSISRSGTSNRRPIAAASSASSIAVAGAAGEVALEERQPAVRRPRPEFVEQASAKRVRAR